MVKVNTSEAKLDGGDFLQDECDCHFIVDNAEDFSGQSSPHMEYDLRILAACTPRGETLASAVGKVLKKERFSLSPSAAGRITNFACAMGAYTVTQAKKDQEAGIQPDLPIDAACIGMQFCAPFRRKAWREREDTAYWQDRLDKARQQGDQKEADKAARRLETKQGMLQVGGEKGFTFWALGDPEADHIPLNADAIAPFEGNLPTKDGQTRRRGDKGRESGGPAAGNGHKPTPPKSPPAAAAANIDPAAAAAAAGGFGAEFLG